MENKIMISQLDKIDHYVYYLIDPKSDEIFYVGKGHGDRILAHIEEAIGSSTNSDKLDKIREIQSRNDGFNKVEHFILRHGLSEEEAFLLESSLIDFIGIDNLTNKVKGHHSSMFGKMQISDIKRLYNNTPCNIEDRVLLVNIKQLFSEANNDDDLYEITRKWWILSESRCRNVDYVFAVYKGYVRGVFKVNGWEFSIVDNKKRSAFIGEFADQAIQDKYLDKSISQYIKIGAQNPVKYVNC